MALKELVLDEPGCRWRPGNPPETLIKVLSDGHDGAPQATVGAVSADSRVEAHFHDVPQFQVVLEGKVDFVTHPAEAVAVHYTDPNTAYGFFVSDSKFKLAILRPQKGGTFWMYEPEKRKLRNPDGREIFGQSGVLAWETLTGKLAGVRRKVLFGTEAKGPMAQMVGFPAGECCSQGPPHSGNTRS